MSLTIYKLFCLSRNYNKFYVKFLWNIVFFMLILFVFMGIINIFIIMIFFNKSGDSIDKDEQE